MYIVVSVEVMAKSCPEVEGLNLVNEFLQILKFVKILKF